MASFLTEDVRLVPIEAYLAFRLELRVSGSSETHLTIASAGPGAGEVE